MATRRQKLPSVSCRWNTKSASGRGATRWIRSDRTGCCQITWRAKVIFACGLDPRCSSNSMGPPLQTSGTSRVQVRVQLTKQNPAATGVVPKQDATKCSFEQVRSAQMVVLMASSPTADDKSIHCLEASLRAARRSSVGIFRGRILLQAPSKLRGPASRDQESRPRITLGQAS